MTTKETPKKKTRNTSAVKKTTARKRRSAKALTSVAKAKEGGIERLRIRVRAYEHKLLDMSVKQIIDTALRYDAEIVGPVPLPTEKKRYTVNRSTFVYKDAREQFEMRVHKRMIDILNPTQKVIESLTNLSLPSGVSIDVKML